MALDPVGVALLTEHRARTAQGLRNLGEEFAFVFRLFSSDIEARSPFRPDNVTSFFIRVRNEVGALMYVCTT